MKELKTALGRTEDGLLILGDPDKGCPWCGGIAVKYAGNGKAVVYHPTVECCPERIEQQIKGEQDIKLTHIKGVRDAEERSKQAFAAVGFAQGNAAAERLSREASRAEEGIYLARKKAELKMHENDDRIQHLRGVLAGLESKGDQAA